MTKINDGKQVKSMIFNIKNMLIITWAIGMSYVIVYIKNIFVSIIMMLLFVLFIGIDSIKKAKSKKSEKAADSKNTDSKID